MSTPDHTLISRVILRMVNIDRLFAIFLYPLGYSVVRFPIFVNYKRNILSMWNNEKKDQILNV